MVAAAGSSLAVATHLIMPRSRRPARRLRPASAAAISGATSRNIPYADVHPASRRGAASPLSTTPNVDLPDPYGPTIDSAVPLLSPAENASIALMALAFGMYLPISPRESRSTLAEARGRTGTSTTLDRGTRGPDPCLCIMAPRPLPPFSYLPAAARTPRPTCGGRPAPPRHQT